MSSRRLSGNMADLPKRAAARLQRRKDLRKLLATIQGELRSERLELLDFFDNLPVDKLRKVHRLSVSYLQRNL